MLRFRPMTSVMYSVVRVHTSHELVQSSVHTSKYESFTFIVHHLNSELVHSSVQFIFIFFFYYCSFFRRTSFAQKGEIFGVGNFIIQCVKIPHIIIRWIGCRPTRSVCVSVFAFTCHFYIETESCCLEYVACLVCVPRFMGNVGRSRVSWFRYRRNYTGSLLL